jgi:hypothetical protein
MTHVEAPPPFPFEEDLSADSAPELARLRAAAGPLVWVRVPDGATQACSCWQLGP